MRTDQLLKLATGRRRGPGTARRDGLASAGAQPLTPVGSRTTGTLIGGSAAAVALIAALVVAVRLAQLPASLASLVGGVGVVVLLGAALLFGYWAYSCANLRYWLQDGALVIECGALRHVVPLHAVRDVRKGYTADPGRIFGVSWPGFHVGLARAETIGPIIFYSTHRHHDELVYLVTSAGAFGLSLDEQQLREELARARPSKLARPQVFRWSVLNAAVWSDRWLFGTIGVGLAVNLMMMVYAFARYASLPELEPIRLTPTLIGYPSEALRVPFIALFLWAVDSVLAGVLHGFERLGAYLCVATGVAVQILFLIAVVRLFAF